MFIRSNLTPSSYAISGNFPKATGIAGGGYACRRALRTIGGLSEDVGGTTIRFTGEGDINESIALYEGVEPIGADHRDLAEGNFQIGKISRIQIGEEKIMQGCPPPGLAADGAVPDAGQSRRVIVEFTNKVR